MTALRRLTLVVYIAFFLVSFSLSARMLAVPLMDGQWYMHGKAAPYELIDFSQFYQAGQLAVSADRSRVYDADVQNRWACALVAPSVPDKIFYNQSVPFLYVLLVPFGFLPYARAYVLWCLATMAGAAVSLYLLVSRAGLLKGAERWLFLAGAFASVASYLTVWHGQTTYLLTAAFALTALFLMQKRDAAAGLCLALTTFKPQYLFPFMALAAGLKRGKVLLFLVLFEAMLMASAALFIGVDNIIGYPRVLTMAESSTRFIGVNPQYMVSMRGALSLFLPHKTAMFVTGISLFVALAPLFLACRRLCPAAAPADERATNQSCRWLIALTFVLALILSPHSHYFDCLLLAVPAALTLPTLDLPALLAGKGAAQSLTTPHRIWCAILILYPLLSWPVNFLPNSIAGCLGGREAEGLTFLAVNFVLAVLACLQLRKIGLLSA